GRGTVVGYEALARIEGPAGTVGPAPWFAAARVHGLSAELEAACLAAAFSHRPGLPPECFLSVNVSPDLLAHRSVRDVLDAQGDLRGVVLELAPGALADDGEARAALDHYRRAGATVAVAVAVAPGTGGNGGGGAPVGVEELLRHRPSIVKLDRHLVSGVDRERDRRAVVRRLGSVVGRLEARVVAEGVERVEELEVLADLRVALVQGYALARPGPPWQGIDAVAADTLGHHERLVPAEVDPEGDAEPARRGAVRQAG
ncbi:MAG: EAL domain-containing protein, partial [Acidimicrobiales bacterium]